MTITVGTYRIKNKKDMIISMTKPNNPEKDLMWLDTSFRPAILKQYNGVTWSILFNIGQESTNILKQIHNIKEILNKLADDQYLTSEEKNTVSDMIKIIISHHNYLLQQCDIYYIDTKKIKECYKNMYDYLYDKEVIKPLSPSNHLLINNHLLVGSPILAQGILICLTNPSFIDRFKFLNYFIEYCNIYESILMTIEDFLMNIKGNILTEEYKNSILKDIQEGKDFVSDWELIRELFICWHMDISKIPIFHKRLLRIYMEDNIIKLKDNYI